MNIKNLIKKAIISTCVIFTIITAIYMLILQIVNTTELSAAVEASRVLMFFVFSLLLAIANTLLSISQIHTAIRYMLHYVICVVGFWICFCVPNKMAASKIFVGIVFFTIGYAIIMPLIALFKRRLAKSKAPAQTYEKQFSKKKK